MIVERLFKYSQLVVLPHSIFSLPFALASLVLAWRRGPTVPTFESPLVLLVSVVAAVVAARTAAMSFNRVVDARIDGENPRTSNREIPRGIVSGREAWILCVGSSALFLLFSALLGRHCLILAPAVLAVLLGYSLTKRFTAGAHVVLGLALALAPGGAWWVLRPQIDATPLLLMGAVLVWVTGFDILYSAQDVLFDRRRGIHSLTAEIGIESAFAVSQVLHMTCAALLIVVGVVEHLGVGYWLGTAVSAALLYAQHRTISPFDLSRINRAFFTFNGILSFLYLFGVLLG